MQQLREFAQAEVQVNAQERSGEAVSGFSSFPHSIRRDSYHLIQNVCAAADANCAIQFGTNQTCEVRLHCRPIDRTNEVNHLDAKERSDKGSSRFSSIVQSARRAVYSAVVAAAAAMPLSMPEAAQAKDGAREDVATERVDLIEVNHFYDDQGRLVFDQLLFYDWSHKDGRFQLRAWRMMKNLNQIPQKNHQKGNYETIWNDGDVMRKVSADEIRESWTQYDPELTEREFLPKENRRELRNPKTLSGSNKLAPKATPTVNNPEQHQPANGQPVELKP